MQGPGFFPEGMPPPNSQGGPNLRFPGPINQNGPNRPPFMGPGMDGPPPMGMGPPMVGGPGMMSQGPPPILGQGAPGMQGPPLGPPMSQAAALVGAILRAAPMLQQFRGPNQQGPNTSMANNMPSEPRFMGSNMDGGNMMGQGMNMGNQNMMGGQGMNSGMMGGSGINQDTMMGDMQHGMMGDDQDYNNAVQQPNPTAPSMSTSIRDPRKAGSQNDPRLQKTVETHDGDMDMRSGSVPMQLESPDEDLRQDIDMRNEEASKNQGENKIHKEDTKYFSFELLVSYVTKIISKGIKMYHT